MEKPKIKEILDKTDEILVKTDEDSRDHSRIMKSISIGNQYSRKNLRKMKKKFQSPRNFMDLENFGGSLNFSPKVMSTPTLSIAQEEFESSPAPSKSEVLKKTNYVEDDEFLLMFKKAMETYNNYNESVKKSLEIREGLCDDGPCDSTLLSSKSDGLREAPQTQEQENEHHQEHKRKSTRIPVLNRRFSTTNKESIINLYTNSSVLKDQNDSSDEIGGESVNVLSEISDEYEQVHNNYPNKTKRNLPKYRTRSFTGAPKKPRKLVNRTSSCCSRKNLNFKESDLSVNQVPDTGKLASITNLLRKIGSSTSYHSRKFMSGLKIISNRWMAKPTKPAGPLQGAGDSVAKSQVKIKPGWKNSTRVVHLIYDLNCGDIVLKKGSKLVIQAPKSRAVQDQLPVSFYFVILILVYTALFMIFSIAVNIPEHKCLDESSSQKNAEDPMVDFGPLKSLISAMNPMNLFH